MYGKTKKEEEKLRSHTLYDFAKEFDSEGAMPELDIESLELSID